MTDVKWREIVAEAVHESKDFREFFIALDKKRKLEGTQDNE